MISHTQAQLDALRNEPSSNYLYAIQLGSTNYYLSDGDAEHTFGSETFIPGYIADETEDIEVTSEPKTNDMDIVLLTHNSTFLTDILAGGWMNKPVQIYRRFHKDGATILTLTVFKGLISSYSISEKDHTVTLTVASIWADYEKRAGMRTNVTSHQVHYPGDTGMRHAANATKKVYWGIESPISASNNSDGAAYGGGSPKVPPTELN